MTQKEIILERLKSRHTGNWYPDTPYKSLGSVLHWLYIYTTLDIAETATVGGGDGPTGAFVRFGGTPFAHVYWNDELQMPIFRFLDNSYWKKEGARVQYIYLKDLLHEE